MQTPPLLATCGQYHSALLGSQYLLGCEGRRDLVTKNVFFNELVGAKSRPLVTTPPMHRSLT